MDNETKNIRFKNITPENKLKLSLQLYFTARELKRAGLKMLHPEWSNDKTEMKVKEIFLYART